MSEFKTNTKAFDMLTNENGIINGFVVYLGKTDLTFRILENKGAEAKTFATLLVWLPKNANEIAKLLKSHKARNEGKIDFEIFPLSLFVEAFGDLFPRRGLTLEEFKAGVMKGGITSDVGKNYVSIVIKDDFEVEFVRDNNYIEQIVFNIVIYSLLILLCKIDSEKALNIARDFTRARIPLQPKLQTDDLAVALINLKKAK